MTTRPLADQPTQLRRDLGLLAVTLFGLAYIGPVGVYATYGELVGLSHNTPSGAYLVGMAVMLVTALSYGRMVAIYPVAGSAYTYTRRSLHPDLGFMVGWTAILDYVLLPMVVWLIGAAFLVETFPSVPHWVWIVLLAGVTTTVNIAGIGVAKNVNIGLVVVEIVIIAVFVFLAARYAWLASGPGGLASAKPFFTFDVPLSATMAGAAFAAYSFIGFDGLTRLPRKPSIHAETCASAFSWWP